MSRIVFYVARRVVFRVALNLKVKHELTNFLGPPAAASLAYRMIPPICDPSQSATRNTNDIHDTRHNI